MLILEGREGGRKADLGFFWFCLFVLTPNRIEKKTCGSEMNLQLNLQPGREILTKQTCNLNAVRLATLLAHRQGMQFGLKNTGVLFPGLRADRFKPVRGGDCVSL